MTRILAFADTQLGVATVDLADQRAVLDRIVQVAAERKVDLVIHGGDVFEGPVVTPEQMRCFLDATEALRVLQIPLVVLRGNGRHDAATRSVHALDVLREVDGITVSDRPEMLLFGGITVCTLPWVSPARLLAQLDAEVDRDAVNTTVARMLVEIAADLHAEASQVQAGVFGPANLPCVLVAHWAITGSALPSGLPVEEMREPILPFADLDAIGFDAIVGAHVHEAQWLDHAADRTPTIVCGSPQQLNFGEHGDHGCWVIDLGNDVRPEIEFVPIESRPFVTIALDADTAEQIGEGQLGFADEQVREAMVRVRYSVTEDEAQRIDQRAIREALIAAGAHRVQIEPRVEREARARVEAISETLGPLEALGLYCDATEMDFDLALAMRDRLEAWA